MGQEVVHDSDLQRKLGRGILGECPRVRLLKLANRMDDGVDWRRRNGRCRSLLFRSFLFRGAFSVLRELLLQGSKLFETQFCIP